MTFLDWLGLTVSIWVAVSARHAYFVMLNQIICLSMPQRPEKYRKGIQTTSNGQSHPDVVPCATFTAENTTTIKCNE